MCDGGAAGRGRGVNAFEYQQYLQVARTHWWFRGRNGIIREMIDRATAHMRQPRLLDVGCGGGNVLEALGDRFARFGLDGEPAALRVCQTSVGVPVTRGAATALPFVDGAFDVVVATDLFEHVRDDTGAVRECARVCRDGGVLLGTVPAHPMLYGPHDMRLDHFRRYTRRAFRDVLEAGGFTVQRMTHFNTFLFPPMAAVRLAQRAFVRDPARFEIDYTLGSGPLGRVLLGVLTAERWWLRRANFPFGTSLLAVAMRPTA